MSTIQSQADIKKVIDKFFSIISSGNKKELLFLCSLDCKTHNPYIAGGMAELVDAMIAASSQMSSQISDPEFTVKYILINKDMASVYTQLKYSRNDPGKGGLRQVHIFRFNEGKIVEYWDVTQQIIESMPNAAGAF